jgi:hypothetical protein
MHYKNTVYWQATGAPLCVTLRKLGNILDPPLCVTLLPYRPVQYVVNFSCVVNMRRLNVINARNRLGELVVNMRGKKIVSFDHEYRIE